MTKRTELEQETWQKKATLAKNASEARATKLMIAALSGDAQTVVELAKKNPQAASEDRDGWGQTALMHAADGMDMQCLMALLPLGGAAAADRNGEGALERAVRAGWIPGAIALAKVLDRDGELSSKRGIMPLAAEKCSKNDVHGTLLKILLRSCGAEGLGAGESTPLMFAARESAENWVEALAPVSDPWALSKSGWIALTWAVAGMLTRGHINVRILNTILDRMESALEPQDGREGQAWAVSQKMAQHLRSQDLDSRLERMRAIIEGHAIERATGAPCKQKASSFAHSL